ncbi:hypothetical protein CERZMDRAFT_81277 [Cercospora zeae-maydis SCOH1-5]|uniref:Uncharacterized protein n=1 Tax=Cercospora zeae-maydis SCOH1-5 TaxID=717836 RepID=A0A6A6FVU4_9PEZI|nr:hypothetical protein CERZMDRAFT_81277 [Cercospora zeae-maydis SCOH1-5]
MPAETWKIEERRDLLHMRTEWKAGHRHGHYRTIDPENGAYSAIETQERTLSDQRIRNAAQQTGGRNWLREDASGALALPNSPVHLRPNPRSYIRDPITFDAVFADKQPRRAGLGAAQPAPGTGGQGLTTTARSRWTETARRSTQSAGPSIAGSATRLSRQPATPKSSALVASSQSVQSTPQVPDREFKAAQQSSVIYKHGGELVHIWNPSRQRFDDLIRCDEDVCCKCNDCGRSGDLAIKIRRRPTNGLPFVHLGQDSIINTKGEYVFGHTGALSINRFTVPPHKHTMKVDMWCTSEGQDMRVTVLGCVAERCAICSPATFKANGGDLNYSVDGGLYGENDAVALSDEYGAWSDTDDEEAGGLDVENVEGDNE